MVSDRLAIMKEIMIADIQCRRERDEAVLKAQQQLREAKSEEEKLIKIQIGGMAHDW